MKKYIWVPKKEKKKKETWFYALSKVDGTSPPLIQKFKGLSISFEK